MSEEENKINPSALENQQQNEESVSYEDRGFSAGLGKKDLEKLASIRKEMAGNTEEGNGSLTEDKKDGEESLPKNEKKEDNSQEVSKAKKVEEVNLFMEMAEKVLAKVELSSEIKKVFDEMFHIGSSKRSRSERELLSKLNEFEQHAFNEMRGKRCKLLDRLAEDIQRNKGKIILKSFIDSSSWRKGKGDSDYVHSGNIEIKLKDYLKKNLKRDIARYLKKIESPMDLPVDSKYEVQMFNVLKKIAGKIVSSEEKEDSLSDRDKSVKTVKKRSLGEEKQGEKNDEEKSDSVSKKTAEVNSDDIKNKEIAESDFERGKMEAEDEQSVIEDIEKEKKEVEEEQILEVPEDNTEDRETLDDLMSKVEETRNTYAAMEQRKRGKWESVSNYFKGFLKKSSIESDPELLSCKNAYKEALSNYRSRRIEILREEFKEKKSPDGKDVKVNLSGNEDFEKKSREIFEFFNYEEVINLYNARTDAKIESMKGTKMEVLHSGIKKMHDFYSGLSLKNKLVIAAGTMAAGYAIAVPGMASLLLARKLAGGAIAGYGTAKTLDALAQAQIRKSARKDSGKNVSEFLKDAQYYWDNLEARLQFDLESVDKKMNGLKVKSYFNKTFGAAIGLTIGASGFAKMAESFNFAETPKGTPGLVEAEIENGDARIEVEKPFDTIPTEDSSVKEIGGEPDIAGNVADAEDLGQLGLEASIENAPENIAKLTVEKGSSLEGTLIEYIKDHKSEIYEHHPELKGQDAGWIAHRMTLDFMAENRDKFPEGLPNLIHPGAEISINPASLEIESIYDSQGMAQNLDGSGSNAEYLGDRDVESNSSFLEDQSRAEDLSDRDAIGNTDNTVEDYDKSAQVLDGIISQSNLAKLDKVDFKEVVSPQKSFLDNTINLQKQFAVMVPNTALEAGRTSELDKWNVVKNFKATELEQNSRLNKMFDNFYKNMGEYGISKGEIEPSKGESLRQWTGRIVKKVMSS